MIFIAHRGNIVGPEPELENHPARINFLLQMGVNVEVDVWYVNKNFYYGHDEPTHKVSEIFLTRPKMWLHAKNADALFKLLELGCNVFWHQEDDHTLTSHGYVWTYPEKQVNQKSVIVDLDVNWRSKNHNCMAVCSDYIL